ncbi:MAG: GNAT family N-acetyltransferase [Flavipsychrobacter sp.]|nr:GNAT family N-acetyltransferase [Flavipsychrobacter sp.]
MEPINIPFHDYVITTDRSRLSAEAAHQWLTTESYWSKQISYEVVKRAFDHSFVIGILHGGEQVGYGRLVTDYATFGHLADVYVLEAHRGKGLSKKMMSVLMDIDFVKKLRNISLGTLDAHGLYEPFGFRQHEHPERILFISRPDIYGDVNNPCR